MHVSLAALVVFISTTGADTAQIQQPQPNQDPPSVIANIMAGVAFASRCNAITPEESGDAVKLAMIYGNKHGIDYAKTKEIGQAAIDVTSKMPDYTFTDSLCSLYATGIHNLLIPMDK